MREGLLALEDNPPSQHGPHHLDVARRLLASELHKVGAYARTHGLPAVHRGQAQEPRRVGGDGADGIRNGDAGVPDGVGDADRERDGGPRREMACP